ncbi:MAG: condensation domain-containing protein [Pseudomonadota bacterium]
MSRTGLEGVEDILPLSAVQSGMLYEAIAPDAAPGLYIGGVLAKLTGPLDPAGLRQAFETEVLSRDAYRVALFWEGLKQPVQMVQTHLRVPWKTLDYSHLGKAEAEAKVTALLQAERRKPLNLNAAPLMRFTLVKVSETEHRLLWIIHHLISDGWSTGTVLQKCSHFGLSFRLA